MFYGDSPCVLQCHRQLSNQRNWPVKSVPCSAHGNVVHFMNDFSQNLNSIENSIGDFSFLGNQITTNVCTCHASTAGMACAKFGSDHLVRIWIRGKCNKSSYYGKIVGEIGQLETYHHRTIKLCDHHPKDLAKRNIDYNSRLQWLNAPLCSTENKILANFVIFQALDVHEWQ